MFRQIGLTRVLILAALIAALIIIPFLSAASAIILGGVMIVATLIELFVLHRPPVAAVACLTGHTFVAWARVSHRHRSWLRPENAVMIDCLTIAGNKVASEAVLDGEPEAQTTTRGE